MSWFRKSEGIDTRGWDRADPVAEKMVDESTGAGPCGKFMKVGERTVPIEERIQSLEHAFGELQQKHAALEKAVFESHRKAENAKNLSEQANGNVELLMEFYDKEIEYVPAQPAFRRVVQRGSVKGGPERDTRS